MQLRKTGVILTGSERALPPDARKAADAPDPNARIMVTVMLRPRTSQASSDTVQRIAESVPHARQYCPREESNSARGADPTHIQRIRRFRARFWADGR